MLIVFYTSEITICRKVNTFRILGKYFFWFNPGAHSSLCGQTLIDMLSQTVLAQGLNCECSFLRKENAKIIHYINTASGFHASFFFKKTSSQKKDSQSFFLFR